MKLNEGDLAYKVNHHFGVTVSQVLEAFHSEAEMQLHRQGHLSVPPAIGSTDNGEDVVSDSQAHCFSQLLYDKYNLPLLGLICR